MTRNTHHRVRDHFGTDLDTNVVLNGGLDVTPSGSNVHQALRDLHTRIDALSGNAQVGSQTTLSVTMASNPLTIGYKGSVEMPIAGEITRLRMFSDVVGSIVVDIEKTTFANYPTMSSICGSSKPTLSGAQKLENTALTGWSKSLAAGDILTFEVESVATIKRVTLVLTIVRTPQAGSASISHGHTVTASGVAA